MFNRYGRRETSACCQDIENIIIILIRSSMKNVKTNIVEKHLKVVQIHRKSKRLSSVQSVLIMMKEMKHTEASVQALLHSQEFMAALEVLSSALELLDTDLKGIHAMTPLREKLMGYQTLVRQHLGEQLVSCIVSSEWDFDYTIASLSNDDSMQANVDTLETQHVAKKENLREKMIPLLDSLGAMNAIVPVLSSYRTRVVEEIKVVVKTVLAETIETASSIEGDGKEDIKMSSQLRGLSSDAFLSCLHMIFEHLLLVLQRVSIVHGILVDWKKDTVQDDERCIAASDKIVQKVCDFSQNSVSNLFAARKEVQVDIATNLYYN